MSNEHLVETFVELADTLIDEFDVIDFLHLLVDRCVELLDVDAAGLLLADSHGRLQLIASSNEQVRLLELFQLQNDEGPCLDPFRTGTRVSLADLSTADERWPRFAEAAADAGFAAVDALPMRLRKELIGALNLFRTEAGDLDATALRTAQALVDVATIGLLQERSLRHQEIPTVQLQTALNSRVVIEQAKGLVAGTPRRGHGGRLCRPQGPRAQARHEAQRCREQRHRRSDRHATARGPEPPPPAGAVTAASPALSCTTPGTSHPPGSATARVRSSTMSTTDATTASPTAVEPYNTCAACPHDREAHDPIGTRFCSATITRGLDRACVCVGDALASTPQTR